MHVLGILNVTRDSFSDGGRFLAPAAAIAHARQLVADGADFVDIGAESTHPDSENVPAEAEIARLAPIVDALIADGIAVSVDTYKPAVMRAALERGVGIINDVTGLRDPENVAAVVDSNARVIIMHSTAQSARAERRAVAADTIVGRVIEFFAERVASLVAAGIARERLILDPGMGFFLGTDPEVSLAVLRAIPRLREQGLPICISTSRKSFVGALLSDVAPRPVAQRGAGTLATELWAAHAGAEFIRTHDVRALRDAEKIWKAIAGPRADE